MMRRLRQAERTRMVERQIAGRGISDPRVLEAFLAVPREAFVPDELAACAYDDTPLPIGEGQTISQPYVVALMAEAARIEPDARVLEVGAGSGYAAAIFAGLAAEVITIERHAALAASARLALASIGIRNVEVVEADGALGWPPRAPYDAILVAAGAPTTPEALKAQLAEGGRLVVPVEFARRQDLLLFVRRGDAFEKTSLGPVRFVPLISEAG